MRGILFNWIFEVHNKYTLKQRTLFLTANIFDRYLFHRKVPRNKLQLVGIASLVIASKFEDIYPPELEQIAYLCENIYSKEEIINSEGDILFNLNFNLIFVSSLDVLQLLFKRHSITNKSHKKLSVLVVKMFLFHSHSGKFDSFALAAFALNLANLILFDQEFFTHSREQPLPFDNGLLLKKL